MYRKNLFTKEKLNKKEQHQLYTLLTIYRSNIVGKTNQFKHNSLFINLICLQYYLSQWSWPKIDTYIMKINICATPVSLAAFVAPNVCDNVRLHHLQECLYYRIQEEGNCSRRGCILLRDGFFFGGGGVGEGIGIDGGYIRLVEGVTHIFCAC